MELSPESKSLIKEEVELRLENSQQLNLELQAVVREQKFWLNVIRVFAVLIAGGSIYGALNFGEILDNHISQRMSLLDQLPIAISNAETDRWEDALNILDGMWKPVIEEKKINDNGFVDNYLINYAWVLLSDPLNANDKKYNQHASRQWKRLVNQKRFKELENELSSDFSFQETLVLAGLKFAPNKKMVDKAFDVLSNLREFVYSDFQMADLSYNLAMIEILRGNEQEASEHFLMASNLNPDEYLVSDWNKYRASFTGDSDYLTYSYIANKLGIDDFGQRIERAFATAVASPSLVKP